MKKLVLVLAISSFAPSAFAAANNSPLQLMAADGSGLLVTLNNLSRVPFLDISGGKVTNLFPYTQSYTLNLPGFGSASSGHPVAFTLPGLGVLTLSYKNSGAGGTFAYTESLSDIVATP